MPVPDSATDTLVREASLEAMISDPDAAPADVGENCTSSVAVVPGWIKNGKNGGTNEKGAERPVSPVTDRSAVPVLPSDTVLSRVEPTSTEPNATEDGSTLMLGTGTGVPVPDSDTETLGWDASLETMASDPDAAPADVGENRTVRVAVVPGATDSGRDGAPTSEKGDDSPVRPVTDRSAVPELPTETVLSRVEPT